jgi:hypothetical protein
MPNMQNGVNCGVRVRTHDICYNVMLNHQLLKKLKLIKINKFNHLINVPTTVHFNFIRIFISYPLKLLEQPSIQHHTSHNALGVT